MNPTLAARILYTTAALAACGNVGRLVHECTATPNVLQWTSAVAVEIGVAFAACGFLGAVGLFGVGMPPRGRRPAAA